MPRLWRPLHVQHAVERRRSTVARHGHVGAAPEQTHREIEVPVDRRHEQRARAIRCAHLIDVGSAVEQRKHGVLEAFARRQQQRCQPALGADEVGVAQRLRLSSIVAARRPGRGSGPRRGRRCPRRCRGRGCALLLDGGDASVTLAALRAVLAIARADVDDFRRRARIGAAHQQRFDRLGPARSCREHQGRLSPLRLLHIDIGAVIQEERDRLGAARRCGEMQRRSTRGGRRADVGFRIDEPSNDEMVTALGGDVKRRMPSDARDRIWIGAGREQQPGELLIALLRGPVKRVHPVALRAVHVSALQQQGAYGCDVAPHGGIGYSRVRPARHGCGPADECHRAREGHDWSAAIIHHVELPVSDTVSKIHGVSHLSTPSRMHPSNLRTAPRRSARSCASGSASRWPSAFPPAP